MRVLLISHTCQSVTEGQARVEYLAKLGDIDLRVLIPDRWFHYGKWRMPQIPRNPAYSCEAGKVIWPWLCTAQWYLHWYPGLHKILQEFKPDIIDLWEEPWCLVSAHTCWLRNRILPRTKIVSETEQNINKSLPFPFEIFRSYTLKNADFVICRSNGALEVLRKKGYHGQAEIIPNGVDINLFRPLDRIACRRELGISGFTIGYVGRLVKEKGLIDIIEALSMCPDNVNCIFVGDGPLRKRLLRRSLTLASHADEGKMNRVRFIPTMLQEELPKVMNAIDVLVLVSSTTKRWKEQFGRVIAEAGACGTAVIGSDSGAIVEIVGEAGLTILERDPKALTCAINRLHEDPSLRSRLGAIGRKQAEDNYSWEHVAGRLKDIYSRMLGNR